MGRVALAESMRIAAHLRDNAMRFHRDRLTLKQVAVEVSQLIGKPYSPASICRLRQQLGLDWGKRHGKRAVRV